VRLQLTLVLVLFLTAAGCTLKSEPSTYVERLNFRWRAGQQWNVEVTSWPDRLMDPTARGDTRIRQTWNYRVDGRTETSNGARRLLVRGPRSTYFLRFSPWNNMLSVHRAIQRLRSGIVKSQLVVQNDVGHSPMFSEKSSGDTNTFWYFPDLGGTEMNEWNRYPRMISQQTTGEWIEQKVQRIEGGLRFEIRNRTRSVRTEFRWMRGSPWWTSATRYQQHRVIKRGITRFSDPSLPSINKGSNRKPTY